MQHETLKKAQEILNDKIVPIKEALLDIDLNPISTGIYYFDSLMAKERRGVKEDNGGFRKGDFIIVSGHSQHGKSLIGINLMVNLARQDHKALLFSYEVIINNLYEKIEDIFIDSGENVRNIYTTKLMENNNIEWILEKMGEAVERGIDVVVIDQLDFLVNKKADNRREEIGMIIESLKTFAKNNGIIVILQAQVTKNENNFNKSLQMHMLADSRKLYNVPDYIIFVMRNMEDGIPVGNGGILRLAKNRFNGKNGDIEYSINVNNKLKI